MKNRTFIFKNSVLAIAVSGALASLSGTAFAASAAGETELQEVVVKGEKTTGKGGLPQNLPANSAGYSAQELFEQVNVINTEDIVKYSPDTSTRKRYIGDRNAIIQTRTAGPTSSARSLVYLDGILISNLLGNSFAYPPRWNMVSPEEINRVDFFFGPHSAQFPGNSIGTTVFLTTKMPQEFVATAKVQAFRENFKLYGTNSSFNGNKEELLLGSKAGNFTYVMTANHLESQGHPMQFAAFGQSSTLATGADKKIVSGVQRDTDLTGASRLILGGTSIDTTRQENFKIKVAYDFSPNTQLSYNLGLWQNRTFNRVDSYVRDASGNVVLTGNVNIDGYRYSLANSFAENRLDQEHWFNALTLKSKVSEKFDWEAIAGSYKIGDEQRASLPGGTTTTIAGKTYYGTYQKNGSGDGWQTFDLRGNWRSGEGRGRNLNEATFGYHYDQYKLNASQYYTTLNNNGDWQSTNDRNQANTANVGKTSTQALYLQDAVRLGQSSRLIAGGRYEQWEATGGSNAKVDTTTGILSKVNYDDRSLERFSPKVAFEQGLSENWLAKLSLSQAYRFPTVTELFQSITVGNALTVNNPNLKPENAHVGELTVERYLNKGLLRLSIFEEDMHDALVSQLTTVPNSSQVSTIIQNVDHVRTRGATLAYQERDVLVKGLDLTGSATFASSRTLENVANRSYEGKSYIGIPKWRLTGVSTYHFNDTASFTLAGRYSGRQYNTLDNSDTNPNTYTGNSSLFVIDTRFTYAIQKNLKLAIGIDNLNNYKYYYYHPMNQRTLHAEVKYDF